MRVPRTEVVPPEPQPSTHRYPRQTSKKRFSSIRGGTANLAVPGGNLPPIMDCKADSPKGEHPTPGVGLAAGSDGPLDRSTRNRTAGFRLNAHLRGRRISVFCGGERTRPACDGGRPRPPPLGASAPEATRGGTRSPGGEAPPGRTRGACAPRNEGGKKLRCARVRPTGEFFLPDHT